MRLLCALDLFLALLHVTTCLRIGAFNIQNFGDKKSKDDEVTATTTDVMAAIRMIVQRYDIILIQEVRDPDGTVTKRLLELVNVKKSPPEFECISSEPLGDSYKERYLFLYRGRTVSVKDSFQYKDEAGDFMRPPFVVKFSSPFTAVTDFVLIPIHTSPLTAAQAAKKNEKSEQGDEEKKKKKKSTTEQLDALVKVVEAAKERWTNTNIMVLGDFNAGTNYVKNKDWKKIRLFTDKGFHSLINDDVDTRVIKSPQAYDRIVVSDDMNKGVVKGSAKVFDLTTDVDFHLKQEEAEDVSDHFPVQVELELKEELGKRRALKSDVELEPKPYKKLKV